MSFRQIIILLVSLIYFVLCYRYFNADFFTPCCDGAISQTTENIIPPIETEEEIGPIVFNFNEATPITKIDFQDYKSEILADGEDAEGLEIIGYYFDDEEKPEGDYDNIGMLRASRTKSLFSPPIDEDKIQIRSEKISKGNIDTTKPFESVAFNWLEKKDFDEPKIQRTASGDIHILFNSNSVKFEESGEVDEYLNSIAERLESDDQLFADIIGYTDGTGEPGPNRRLSRARAKVIRNILLEKGASRSQLKYRGRGESDPVAPNKVESDRRLNRRVIIVLDTKDK